MVKQAGQGQLYIVLEGPPMGMVVGPSSSFNEMTVITPCLHSLNSHREHGRVVNSATALFHINSINGMIRMRRLRAAHGAFKTKSLPSAYPPTQNSSQKILFLK